jgi:iron complex transport system substrate-binding protein
MAASSRQAMRAFAVVGALVAGACQPAAAPSPAAPSSPSPSAAATASPEPSPSEAGVVFPLEIEDASGATVTFEGPPERVGCWWLGCLEVMADLGVTPHAAEDALEGAFFFPAGEPEVGIADTFSVEEWAAADIDLFVADLNGFGDNTEAFAQITQPFYLHTPFYADTEEELRGVDAYVENVRLMGQVLDRTAEADAAIERFESLVAELKERAPEGAPETVVSGLWASNEGQYFLLEANSPFCDVLETNGLATCIDEEGEINAEAYLAIDPDWIAYIAFGSDSWTARPPDPVWSKLSAVKNEQVYDSNGRGDGATRIFCCSLRGLEHALLEFGHEVWGEEGGIPDPGPAYDYDPSRNPLLTAPS